MSANRYPHLTAEGRIGSLVLRNRFVVTAMGAGLGEEDGTWGEAIRAYHEEQAKGGVGLIVTGVTGVAWPHGASHKRQVGLSEDRFIPGLAAVVKATHRHDAKLAVQLHHGGPGAHAALASGLPSWTPSPLLPGNPAPNVMLPDEVASSPHAQKIGALQVMTLDDIATVVSQFAAAARRAVAAGVDGIEIHGGHGYLLSSFLSPRKNRRTDAYGGTHENRARLLLEVIGAIRAEVGSGFPLWCKLDSREEGAEPAITIEDAARTAQMAEAAGVNAITVTAVSNPERPLSATRGHTPMVPAVNLPAAARIKAAVRIPIIASGRVELDVAEAAITDGRLDFLSMGRKLLADPHLPRKVLEGRTEAVRPCIYCSTCISSIVMGRHIRCAVNPLTGFEAEARPVAGPRQRVVVVGGGPAGLEVARRLNLAGHEVVLVEQEDRLGGTLRFAALAYPENGAILEWLKAQVVTSGVEVRLKTAASPQIVRDLSPDTVVVATGARRSRPQIPGADLPHVFSGDDLKGMMLGHRPEATGPHLSWGSRLALAAGATLGLTANTDFVRRASRWWMPLGRRVVIVGGDLVGLELAEFLSERRRQVVVVDEAAQFGRGLPYTRRAQLLAGLVEHGVGLWRGVAEIRIEPNAVTVETTEGIRRAPADNVILAKGATGDLSLAETLRASGLHVLTAGDCLGVGFIEGAIRGAAHVAEQITTASWEDQAPPRGHKQIT